MIVDDPRALRAAWDREHRRLARHIAGSLPRGPIEVIELGGGAGQLTIPLVEARPRARWTVVDRFSGPYSGTRMRLRRSLGRLDARPKVRIVSADVRRWRPRAGSASVEAVVSGELLPELTAREMRSLFRAGFRWLAPGGVAVHSFLSPDARTPAQSRTIEADSVPRTGLRAPDASFSPAPETVRSALRDSGFRGVRVSTLPSRLRFRGGAARRQLRDWGVPEDYLSAHAAELSRDGIELPDWVVVRAVRPRRAGPGLRESRRPREPRP